MSESLNKASIDELVALGRESAKPQMVVGGNVPYVLVPDGCKVQSVPELIFNDHAATPERIRANVGVLDPQSFIQYHTLFADANSQVFANEMNVSVVGVLDYHAHGQGTPRWGQHRVTLTLHHSEEWKIWIGKNNVQMNQQVFSEFLEQNAMDVTKPTPASMMEIAGDLHATTEVEFGSGLRQQDGQIKFKYTETTTTKVGAGQVSVPDRFMIEIPVFVGGERIDMEALLRFRMKEGKLTFFYTLVRPEEVKRTAFIAARDHIASDLKIVIINGTPGA